MAQPATKELKDTLWKAANKLRGTLPASQYKDVILGLVFLKYVSDADDERPNGTFKVPSAARWKALADNAKSDSVGQLVDQAMAAVMTANPRWRGHCRSGTTASTNGGSVSSSACSTMRDSAGRVSIAPAT